jgi:hypothetical protein
VRIKAPQRPDQPPASLGVLLLATGRMLEARYSQENRPATSTRDAPNGRFMRAGADPTLKILNSGGYRLGHDRQAVLLRGHEVSRWWRADRGCAGPPVAGAVGGADRALRKEDTMSTAVIGATCCRPNSASPSPSGSRPSGSSSTASPAPGYQPGPLSCSSRASGRSWPARTTTRPAPSSRSPAAPRGRWPSSYTSTARNSPDARASPSAALLAVAQLMVKWLRFTGKRVPQHAKLLPLKLSHRR